MPRADRSSCGTDLAEVHRILRKVLAHETPTAAEIAFLRQLRIELFDHFRRRFPEAARERS